MIYILTTVLLFFASCASFNKNSKINLNQKYKPQVAAFKPTHVREKSIMHELTGEGEAFVSQLPSDEQLKNKPLSVRHYYAGLRAVESKNYILAIKQFNTVIQKYPRSKEVKLSFLAKSKLYKEMGLKEPASYNFKLAQAPISVMPLKTVTPPKFNKKLSKVRDHKKTTK